MASAATWGGLAWNMEPGESTFKYLKLGRSPRSVALSGAGLADPAGADEVAENPAAAAFVPGARLTLTETRMTSRNDGDYAGLTLVQPWGDSRWFAGVQYLGYADIDGRDEDGFETGAYGAMTWDVSLGVADSTTSGATAGIRFRFLSQSIAEFNAKGALFDLSLGQRLGSYLRFAVAAQNVGWVQAYESVREHAPLLLRSGISAQIPLQRFAIPALTQPRIHVDLQRFSDEDPELCVGFETDYHNLLIFRVGYAWGNGPHDLSGGLALRLDRLEVSYGYASNPEIKGNHVFGLGLAF